MNDTITIRNIPLNGTRPNPNMREVSYDNGRVTIFYSYRTPVAAKIAQGPTEFKYLRTKKHYSVTTSKHLNKWFARNTVAFDTIEMVDASEIKNLVPPGISL